jgi:ParB-like chromosome segregation protein Spo0J
MSSGPSAVKTRTKKVNATVLATSSEPETLQTVHGEVVPVHELTHIAPYLHRFAIRVSELSRDPENARKHGKRDLSATSNSLRRFGQTLPILFRPQDKVVIVGNGRHECATAILEWKYIAACPFNGTREQAKAYGLADNRTAELSEWDQEKLAQLVDELGDLENLTAELGDFRLEEIGLGSDDLAEIGEQSEEKQKKKATAVEAKASESVSAKFFNIVIKCGSEKHQIELLEAIEKEDAKGLIKLLNGADVRTQN